MIHVATAAPEIEVSLVFRHFHPILAGAAERFRRYSLPLAQQGIGYQVYTLRESAEHAEAEQMHAALWVQRISAQGLPLERDAALFAAAWRGLAQPASQGRLLQTSLCHHLAAPWLRRISAAGTRCLYVGTMVGREESGVPLLKRWVRRWRDHQNHAPFHAAVASTTVMARYLERLGFRRERIQVILNGVDVERFRPVADVAEKRSLRERLGLPAAARVVVFAGSIVPRKGVDMLVRVWPQIVAQMPDARLVLVGGFDRPTFMTQERMQELTRFQDSLRAQAARPEAGGSITFTGECAEVQDWLRAADVFAFPSEQEGMGNVVLEAMACGLPCVITQFHGMPEQEFGKPSQEFCLVPREDDALVGGLLRTLAADGAAAAMGRAARDWACKELDVRLTIERYAVLYRRLAGH